MNATQSMPGADEARRKQISKWHAQGMDVLDKQGIPRFKEVPGSLHEFILPERIEMLVKELRPHRRWWQIWRPRG